LRSSEFTDNDKVKEVIPYWLHKKPNTFYCSAFKKFVGHWAKFIEKQGGCVESNTFVMSERYVQKMPVKNCGNFDDPACMHFIDSTEQDEEQVTVQNIKFGGHL
jgi:hypothetical protein